MMIYVVEDSLLTIAGLWLSFIVRQQMHIVVMYIVSCILLLCCNVYLFAYVDSLSFAHLIHFNAKAN